MHNVSMIRIEANRELRFTSPRLRGEVGSQRRCDPGEGDPPRTKLSLCSWREPLTPALSPQERGRGRESHMTAGRELVDGDQHLEQDQEDDDQFEPQRAAG